MEFSDIFELILVTLFLRFFLSYKKVMENRSVSSNSSVYFSMSDNSGSNVPTGNRARSLLKVANNENFFTSTPTMQSELGRKVLRNHFLENCPRDLEFKMENLSTKNVLTPDQNIQDLSEKIQNLTVKSSRSCLPKTGRVLVEKEFPTLCRSLSSVRIITPETRKRTENLYEEIFFPEPKKAKIPRKTLRI